LAVDRIDPVGAWALERHGIGITDGQWVVTLAKKVKLAEELTAIRNANAVCEEAIRRMRQAMVPGITEQALWSHLHQANIELGGSGSRRDC
jgi:Xaa-Pro aminopeptidase